jgi:hypothetical protein
MTLHGPKGDVNGALVEYGAIVRLPPPEAERFISLLSPGQVVAMVTARCRVQNVAAEESLRRSARA